ncbi:MAG: DEAD/DEAH box helicase [Planctomycetota bacterium]|nr:DEAD/DEAH box helicase [Planctomycetota bacterium]
MEVKPDGPTFASLELAAPIMDALREERYETPTPIQAQAIPPVLQGRDVLGCAQTGTGKTAAFALPILHRLLSRVVDHANATPTANPGHANPNSRPRKRQHGFLPRALILSPTRELATQIGDSFATYGRHTGLVHTCIYGGVSQNRQVRALDEGVDVLVATPGRLIDLMEQRLVDLSRVSVFVLDEADRMLDMGFIKPIRTIAASLPMGRQTLLFSATMPREILHLAESLLKNPVKVAVAPVAATAALIEQSLYFVDRGRKATLLQHLLREGDVERAVVFTKTKHGADRLAKRLVRDGITAGAIHGNKAQNQRERALDAFRTGRSRVLVATDVAARGLDVDGITHVFNFDLPMEPEAYVHRIGRTGRAGAKGVAIAFCDHEERGLLRDIERVTGKRLATVALPELPPEPPRMPSDHERGPGPRARVAHVRGKADDRDSDRGERPHSDRGGERASTHRGADHRGNEQRGQGHNQAPRGQGSGKGGRGQRSRHPLEGGGSVASVMQGLGTQDQRGAAPAQRGGFKNANAWKPRRRGGR